MFGVRSPGQVLDDSSLRGPTWVTGSTGTPLVAEENRFRSSIVELGTVPYSPTTTSTFPTYPSPVSIPLR